MKRIIKTLGIASILALSLGIGEAEASEREEEERKGNGNDGCQIGLPGHKNGQSNEHKIDYMTKTEWEAYLIANGLNGKQISNNEGSNGWITYYIYDNQGEQIEVVHIRFKREEAPPIVDEKPEEKPPVEEMPPIEEIEKPEVE